MKKEGKTYRIGDQGSIKQTKRKKLYKTLALKYILPKFSSNAATLINLERLLKDTENYGGLKLPALQRKVDLKDIDVSVLHELACFMFTAQTGKILFHGDCIADKKYYIKIIGTFNPKLLESVLYNEFVKVEPIEKLETLSETVVRRSNRFKIIPESNIVQNKKRVNPNTDEKIIRELRLQNVRYEKKKAFKNKKTGKIFKRIKSITRKIISKRKAALSIQKACSSIFENANSYAEDVIAQIKEEDIRQHYIDLTDQCKQDYGQIIDNHTALLFNGINENNLAVVNKKYDNKVNIKALIKKKLKDPKIDDNFKQTIKLFQTMPNDKKKFKFVLSCFQHYIKDQKMPAPNEKKDDSDYRANLAHFFTTAEQLIADSKVKKLIYLHYIYNYKNISDVSYKGIMEIIIQAISVGKYYIASFDVERLQQSPYLLKTDYQSFAQSQIAIIREKTQSRFQATATRLQSLAEALYEYNWSYLVATILHKVDIANLSEALLTTFCSVLQSFEDKTVSHKSLCEFVIEYFRFVIKVDKKIIKTILDTVGNNDVIIYAEMVKRQSVEAAPEIGRKLTFRQRFKAILLLYADYEEKIQALLLMMEMRESISDYFAKPSDVKRLEIEMFLVCFSCLKYMETFQSGLIVVLSKVLIQLITNTKFFPNYIAMLIRLHTAIILVINDQFSEGSMTSILLFAADVYQMATPEVLADKHSVFLLTGKVTTYNVHIIAINDILQEKSFYNACIQYQYIIRVLRTYQGPEYVPVLTNELKNIKPGPGFMNRFLKLWKVEEPRPASFDLTEDPEEIAKNPNREQNIQSGSQTINGPRGRRTG